MWTAVTARSQTAALSIKPSSLNYTNLQCDRAKHWCPLEVMLPWNFGGTHLINVSNFLENSLNLVFASGAEEVSSLQLPWQPYFKNTESKATVQCMCCPHLRSRLPLGQITKKYVSSCKLKFECRPFSQRVKYV